MAAKKKIAALTPEQAAELPRFRARWFGYGTSCEPADRPRAEAAITKMYELIGKPAPRFLWFSSPAASMVAIKILGDERLRDSLGSQLRSQLGSQLRSQLGSQLESQLGSQLWSQLGSQLWSQLVSQLVSQLESQLVSQPIYVPTSMWGQMDAAWVASFTVCQEIGATYSEWCSATLSLWADLAQSCGWWWPYENYCVISDRPQAISWNADQSRLHCEDGPAVLYRDGYALYSWRGTRVPGKWIEEGATVPVADVLAEQNADVRTAGLQIVGWARVLKELSATAVDTDADESIGTLYRVDLPGEPDQRILKAKCGTGREIALRVPPTMTSALQASAWTYGLEAHEYNPEVRT